MSAARRRRRPRPSRDLLGCRRRLLGALKDSYQPAELLAGQDVSSGKKGSHGFEECLLLGCQHGSTGA